MATLYTQRAIIVARQAFATNANLAAKLVDVEGGERTFTTPLRNVGDATNTPVAQWCNWALTPAEVTSLRTRFQAQGAVSRERTMIAATQRGTYAPNLSDRLYCFDAREGVGWTPQEVLDVLGLDTLAPPAP